MREPTREELPSWGKVIAQAAAFVALTAVGQVVIVWTLTGEWFGNPDDHPLWVGPLSAGLALFNTIGMYVAALFMRESWCAQAETPKEETT